MNEHQFSNRPFVAGSLTGVRAYRVTADGELAGIHFRQVVQPGENRAEHRGFRFASALRDIDAHRLVTVDCTCGFYAYFDGSDDYMSSMAAPGLPGEARVEAIVEGYGACVVGSRGFRAEKLRLVAIIRSDPPKPRARRVGDRVARFLGKRPRLVTAMILLGCAGGLAAGAMCWFVSAWWGLPEIALFLIADATRRLFRRGWRALLEDRIAALFGRVAGPTTADWGRIRAKYPDVPVYASRQTALAVHPLTVPDAP